MIKVYYLHHCMKSQAPNKHPFVAVDTLIFTVRNNKLAVLLAQIGSGPYKDQWCSTKSH
jgi:hypothetical protein